VLGTLVGSAYGFFATQKANIETLWARSMELNLTFRQYGAETQPLREALRASMMGADNAIWRNGTTYRQQFDVRAYMSKFERWNQTISSLSPHTPAQTQLLSSMIASSGGFQQTRVLTSLQLASPLSWPRLLIVVSWAMLLFCGFGLLSSPNSTSAAALGLGSFAVASAVFLILELSQPYTGLFRIPPASMERTLEALNSHWIRYEQLPEPGSPSGHSAGGELDQPPG
jgi:hypothetical protein